jgi:hypothetical protein
MGDGFRRAGHPVALHDADPARCSAHSPRSIRVSPTFGRPGCSPSRRSPCAGGSSPPHARRAGGAVYVQENIAEILKPEDAVRGGRPAGAPDAILASSTSTIIASRWSEGLPGRARCIVAHP